MTELSPRERRHQRTQQAIIDAARQIISKQGVEALSIRAIAEKIDYSPAGLYEYFGSKEEIIGALCSQGHRRLRSSMEHIDRNLPPDEYLVAIGAAYVGFAVQNPDYFMLMFGTSPTQTTPLMFNDVAAKQQGCPQESTFSIFSDIVKHGISQEYFRVKPGFDATGMAFAAWSMVHGIAMLRVTQLPSREQNFEKLIREALGTLNRGLMA